MNDYLDDGAQTSDAELLSNFRSTRDETAFRILVKRHAGMVRATALRITGLAVVADEIAQSVFILLARKAPSLQAADTLGPWLHRVAVLQATASVRKENRRRVLLHVWAAGQTIDESASDPAWQEALPALDEAIHALPEQEQRLVVMRFYERVSYRDAGLALGGKSPDAVRMQLQRTLERMAGFLRRRGVGLPLAALAGLLGSAGHTEAFPERVECWTRAALAAMPAPAGKPPTTLGAVHLVAGAALFLAGAGGMQLVPRPESAVGPAAKAADPRNEVGSMVARPLPATREASAVERLLAKINLLENDFEHPEVLAEAILLVSLLDTGSFPVVWEVLLKRAGAKFETGMVPRQLSGVVAARWATKDPPTAFAAAKNMPDGHRCCLIAWETWHTIDAAAAASAVREMLLNAKDTLMPPVWKRLARAAPLLTQELLIEFRDLPVTACCPTMAFQRWMQSRGYAFATENDFCNQDPESGTLAETDRTQTIQFLDSLPVLSAATLRGCVLWLEFVTHDNNPTGPAKECLAAVLRRIPPGPAEREALAAWIQLQPHLSDDLRSALLEKLATSP